MPGRPRSFDRDVVLDRAMECFWRDGYEETTLSTLTDAMGIKPPSLYAAFGDKERLFSEAVGGYGARLTAEMDRLLDQTTTRESIQGLIEGAARFHTAPDSPRGCMVFAEPRLVAERDDVRRRIAARIARGVREGDVDPAADPDTLAALLTAVLRGMSARAREGASHAEVAAIGAAALGALPTR